MTLSCAARVAVTLALAGLVVSAAQAAGSTEADVGRAAANLACHGPNGNSQPDLSPKIADEAPGYLEPKLKASQADGPQNDMTPDVRDVAARPGSPEMAATAELRAPLKR